MTIQHLTFVHKNGGDRLFNYSGNSNQRVDKLAILAFLPVDNLLGHSSYPQLFSGCLKIFLFLKT
ncbi:hypothetical protein [Alysiella crassa]|uniref:hypothetical protein n=1 Tax=Alysiella crassa TaxID=153491 RepID=UPI0011C04C59|nr:hypothetical protein [Alysiella crassa]